MGYYSKRHYAMVSPRQETKQEEAARIAELNHWRASATQALADMRVRFPVLSADNLEDADTYRRIRFEELYSKEAN